MVLRHEVGAGNTTWKKGYKLRRDCVRRGDRLVAQVEAGKPGIWITTGVGYSIDALHGFAAQIEEDLRTQRERLKEMPTQLQNSRLADWDDTVGKERIGWTVASRKLGEIADRAARGLSGEDALDAWDEAVDVWRRACDIRDGRAPIRTTLG